MSFSRFLDHCSARSQFCAIKIQRCRDDECHCLINNGHISNCSRYCLDTVTQLNCPRSELLGLMAIHYILDLMKNSKFSIRMMANRTIPGLMAIHYILDLMKNKFSIRMMANHTIPDITYLPENYHFVIGILLILFMLSLLVCLLLIFLHRTKIVKILKSLWHTNADPPDIQNDLHTTQHLMGEDENILNDFNQIPNTTTDTAKLCTSGSRIDA